MVWHGTARHVMILDCHFLCASTSLRLIKFVKQNDTYDHGCTGTHIFSTLASALFHLSLDFFFFLFGQLLYYMGLIQYRKRICMFFTEQHTRVRARSQYHRIIFEVALFLKWKENSIKDDQSAHSIGRIKQVIFIFIKVVSTQQMCTNHAHTKILFQRRKKKKREGEKKS